MGGRDSLFGQRVTARGVVAAREVGALARERGLTSSLGTRVRVSLLWCKDQPGITAPIIGPRTLAQLQDALGVLDRSFDSGDAARLDRLNGPGNAVSDFHNSNDWMKARVAEPTA